MVSFGSIVGIESPSECRDPSIKIEIMNGVCALYELKKNIRHILSNTYKHHSKCIKLNAAACAKDNVELKEIGRLVATVKATRLELVELRRWGKGITNNTILIFDRLVMESSQPLARIEKLHIHQSKHAVKDIQIPKVIRLLPRLKSISVSGDERRTYSIHQLYQMATDIPSLRTLQLPLQHARVPCNTSIVGCHVITTTRDTASVVIDCFDDRSKAVEAIQMATGVFMLYFYVCCICSLLNLFFYVAAGRHCITLELRMTTCTDMENEVRSFAALVPDHVKYITLRANNKCSSIRTADAAAGVKG